MSMPWSMPASGQWGPPNAMPDMNQMNMGSYSQEQWAAIQQQNWLQWNQWQQQYAQWQNQYGDKYAEQMQAMGGMPPLPPVTGVPPPAPPPPEQPPPPPPPHENNQPLFAQKPQPPPTGVPKPSIQPNTANPNVKTDSTAQQESQSAINADDLQKLTEEERLFDIQFQKWEDEIEKWKKDNVNHPDRQAYKEYEEKFEACRAQLLERRQQMKLKRARLVGSSTPIDTPQQGQSRDAALAYSSKPPNKPNNQNIASHNYSNQSYQTYSKNDQKYDMADNQSKTSWSNKKNPQDKYKSYDDMGSSQDAFPLKDNDTNFLPSSGQSKGIPGLDLVPEPEHVQKPQDIIDITDDQPVGQGPQKNAILDYTNISMGINNILGDEKIMNILSMVKNAPPGVVGPPLPTGAAPSGTSVPPPGAPAQPPYNNSFQNSNWNRNQNVSNNQQFGNRQGPNSFNQAGNPGQPPSRMHDNERNSFLQNQQTGHRGNFPDGPQNRNNQFGGPPNLPRNDQYGNIPPNRNNQFSGPQNMPPRNDLYAGSQNVRNDQFSGGPPNRNNQFGGPQNIPSRNDQFNSGPPNRNNQFSGPQSVSRNDPYPGSQNIPPRNDQYIGGHPNKNSFGGPQNMPPRNDQFGGPQNMPLRNDQFGGSQNMPPRNDHTPGSQNVPPRNDQFSGSQNMQQRNNQYGGPQGMPPRNDKFNNAHPNMPPRNDQFGGPQHMQPRNDQYGANMQQMDPNFNQNMNRGPGPNRPLISSLLDTPVAPPAINVEPPKPKWIEEPLFTPSIIVEYQHLPLRLKARDFIEPVHTFDYNHKSKDEDKKMDFEKEVGDLFCSRKRRNSEIEDDLREKYPREGYSRDTYAKDPYSKDHFTKDHYPRDLRGYPRDPHLKDLRDSRDMYNRDRDSRDLYSRDSFSRESRDIYSRDLRGPPRDLRDSPRDFRDRDPPTRETYRDAFDRDRDRRPTRDSRDDFHTRNFRDADRRRDERLTYREDERAVERSRRSSRDRSRDKSRDRSKDNPDESNNSHSKEKDLPHGQSKDITVTNAKPKTDTPQHIVMIDDLLELPGREMRPEKIVIILRGPPGSGKSYLAKLIRDKEAEHGGTVRIMSIDDYFMQETEVEEKDPTTGKMVKKTVLKYEYDEKSEESYLSSLKRAFKRSLGDGYFSFIIYDAVNDRMKCYADIWNYSRQNGFQVYVCTMELDPQTCYKRNIHNRTLEDIEVICARFVPTLSHHLQLDATTLLQSAAIQDVQMEDATDEVVMEDNQNEVENSFTSRWERMDDENKLARLDGTSKPLRPSQLSMEDYLQLDEWKPNVSKPGKKTVRWADIEERREQEKMRAIGFVVGQTDWNRMTDPTMGSSALTKTKYIERVRRP